MLPFKTERCGIVFYCNRYGLVFGVCNTEVSFDYHSWNMLYKHRSLYADQKIDGRRLNNVKIVVVKAPKVLRGFLKAVFKIKSDD